MKFKMFLFALVVTLAVTVTGCQHSQRSEGLLIEIKNGTDFPKELVGTWVCVENNWRIVIEENGTVSWVLYPMGYVWMEPGKTLEVPMKMGRTSTYAAGPWKAQYDHKGTVLSVEIVIPFFEVGMGPDTLTGDSTDIFTGTVDLEKGLWGAEWISVPTYIVNTAKYEDYQLDSSSPNKGTVIFKRFDVKY